MANKLNSKLKWGRSATINVQKQPKRGITLEMNSEKHPQGLFSGVNLIRFSTTLVSKWVNQNSHYFKMKKSNVNFGYQWHAYFGPLVTHMHTNGLPGSFSSESTIVYLRMLPLTSCVPHCIRLYMDFLYFWTDISGWKTPPAKCCLKSFQSTSSMYFTFT